MDGIDELVSECLYIIFISISFLNLFSFSL